MKKGKMGALNKKEADIKRNKQIFILVCLIIIVVIVVAMIMNSINNNKKGQRNIDISSIVRNAETKIIYVSSSDSKKCKKCSTIRKYLDSQNIKYVTYDVESYSKKEYKEMLKTIEINPDDFDYPAVIYIREGRLYSNIINLEDTKPVKEFIDTYDLKEIK